jgi:hypothetical protein
MRIENRPLLRARLARWDSIVASRVRADDIDTLNLIRVARILLLILWVLEEVV